MAFSITNQLLYQLSYAGKNAPEVSAQAVRKQVVELIRLRRTDLTGANAT
jgi:hypothetical protein